MNDGAGPVLGRRVLAAQPFSALVRAGRGRVVCRCDLITVAADRTEPLCAVARGSVSVTAPRAGV